jgi:hypothetical protein
MALPMTPTPNPGMAAAPPPPMAAGGMPMAPRPDMAPGGAPGAAGGFPAMLAQLAQKGQAGQLPPEIMTVLTFLAGMGFEPFSKATERLRPPQPKTAAGRDNMAAGPGAAPNPQLVQMAQALAARRAGMVPGMNPMGAPPVTPRLPIA